VGGLRCSWKDPNLYLPVWKLLNGRRHLQRQNPSLGLVVGGSGIMHFAIFVSFRLMRNVDRKSPNASRRDGMYLSLHITVLNRA